MAEDENTPRTVRYVYRKSDDYRLIYANGVYGGVTMQGEICVDFFQEYRSAIKMEIRGLEEGGKIGDRVESEIEFQEPADSGAVVFVRERRVGITLHPDQAESIANWMLEKVEQVRGAKKTEETDQNGSSEQTS